MSYQDLYDKALSSPSRKAKACIPYLKALIGSDHIKPVDVYVGDLADDRPMEDKTFELQIETRGRQSEQTADSEALRMASNGVILWDALKQALHEDVKNGTVSTGSPTVRIWHQIDDRPTGAVDVEVV